MGHVQKKCTRTFLSEYTISLGFRLSSKETNPGLFRYNFSAFWRIKKSQICPILGQSDPLWMQTWLPWAVRWRHSKQISPRGVFYTPPTVDFQWQNRQNSLKDATIYTDMIMTSVKRRTPIQTNRRGVGWALLRTRVTWNWWGNIQVWELWHCLFYVSNDVFVPRL